MRSIFARLRGLMLQGKHFLGLARACQAMKAVETSVASDGR